MPIVLGRIKLFNLRLVSIVSSRKYAHASLSAPKKGSFTHVAVSSGPVYSIAQVGHVTGFTAGRGRRGTHSVRSHSDSISGRVS